jgi:hypothetical protein
MQLQTMDTDQHQAQKKRARDTPDGRAAVLLPRLRKPTHLPKRGTTEMKPFEKTADRILGEHGHLLVRRVAGRGDADPVANALYEMAADGRTEWTQPRWSAELRKLDTSDLTLSQWLSARDSS